MVFCYGDVFIKFEPAKFGTLKPLTQIHELLKPSGEQLPKPDSNGFWLFREDPEHYWSLCRVENGDHTLIMPTTSLGDLVSGDTRTFYIYKEKHWTGSYSNLWKIIDEQIFPRVQTKDVDGKPLKNEYMGAHFFQIMDRYHGNFVFNGIFYEFDNFGSDGETIYVKQLDYSFYPLEIFSKLNPVQKVRVLLGNAESITGFVKFKDLNPGLAIGCIGGVVQRVIRVPDGDRSLDKFDEYEKQADSKTSLSITRHLIETTCIKFIDVGTGKFVPNISLELLLTRDTEWSWYATCPTGKIVYVKRACS